MTPARWQVVKEMLATVLALPPHERAAYLNGVSRDDSTLGAELKDLVAAEEAGGDLLERPAIAIVSGHDPETARSRASRRVGPYRIVEQIGLGGMGEVYRAFRADDEYRRQVAIKLIRAGVDSHFVLERFKTERQLLASFDHPNIARLFDGGTTDDGVPYFVMELIEGLSITEYCDRHKLAIADRLRLFCQTCSAVQYAHQRLIIHRDLKPGNILVTAEGAPKLLDFGIAKVVDPGGAADGLETTRSMFRLLTPEYASPEQVKGDAITTASDVYSLGILLCELLTGCRPYRLAGRAPHELAQAVCEFEPKKPSALVLRTEHGYDDSAIAPESLSAARASTPEKLNKLLRGDLDNIVLMALRKEPWRRYPSAAQFAFDVQRHLDGLPVTASNDTLGYRVSKFVTRHRVGVAAASVFALMLVSAGGVTFHEAQVARRERAVADRRFKDMRELARSNLFEFSDAIQNLPGSAAARHLVIQRALVVLDKLSRDAAGDRGLEQELAAGYEKIAALQGNFSGPGIGDSKAAIASCEKALAIRSSLAAASHNGVDELRACHKINRTL
jgi:serine/threonine protein kinase